MIRRVNDEQEFWELRSHVKQSGTQSIWFAFQSIALESLVFRGMFPERIHGDVRKMMPSPVPSKPLISPRYRARPLSTSTRRPWSLLQSLKSYPKWLGSLHNPNSFRPWSSVQQHSIEWFWIMSGSHGGTEVAIEGSFDNWTTRHQLQLTGRNFTIVKLLPPGIYQVCAVSSDFDECAINHSDNYSKVSWLSLIQLQMKIWAVFFLTAACNMWFDFSVGSIFLSSALWPWAVSDVGLFADVFIESWLLTEDGAL